MYGKNKYFIDVTQEICPITFVKVKIKLESMPSGKVLEVKCRGKEAFENISKCCRTYARPVDNKPHPTIISTEVIFVRK